MWISADEYKDAGKVIVHRKPRQGGARVQRRHFTLLKSSTGRRLPGAACAWKEVGSCLSASLSVEQSRPECGMCVTVIQLQVNLNLGARVTFTVTAP
eukprot:3474879-Rhodomonas_salina.1